MDVPYVKLKGKDLNSSGLALGGKCPLFLYCLFRLHAHFSLVVIKADQLSEKSMTLLVSHGKHVQDSQHLVYACVQLSTSSQCGSSAEHSQRVPFMCRVL